MRRVANVPATNADWGAFLRSQRMKLATSVVFFALFVGLLVFAVQRLSIGELSAAMARADAGWLVVGVGLLLCGQLLRLVRWWRILNWEARPDTRMTFRALMGGQVLNWLLPIRLGELWRIWYLNGAKRNSLMWVAGSVVVEKSADSLTLALMAAMLVVVPLPASLPTDAIRLVVSALAGFLFVAAIVAFRSSDWQARFLRRFPQLSGMVTAMQPTESHAEQMRNPWRWIEALATSFAIWLVAVLTNAAVAQAFGIALGVGGQLALMLSIMSVVIVAAVPANAGFPLVVGAVLSLFGVPPTDAFALGLVLYALTYGLNLVLCAVAWIPLKRREKAPG